MSTKNVPEEKWIRYKQKLMSCCDEPKQLHKENWNKGIHLSSHNYTMSQKRLYLCQRKENVCYEVRTFSFYQHLYNYLNQLFILALLNRLFIKHLKACRMVSMDIFVNTFTVCLNITKISQATVLSFMMNKVCCRKSTWCTQCQVLLVPFNIS